MNISIGDNASLELSWTSIGATSCVVNGVADAVVTLEGAVVPLQAGARSFIVQCRNSDTPALVGNSGSLTVHFGELTVDTDEAIAFVRDIGVTVVTGRLRIEGPNITSLSRLSGLLEVGGLEIVGTGPTVTSLAGLENLNRIVGRLAIIQTEGLVSLSGDGAGLISLASVDELSIGSRDFPNVALTSAALPSLATAGLVFVQLNPVLTTVSLPLLASPPQLVVDDNPVLVSLGLQGLQTVGPLNIFSNGTTGTALVVDAPLLRSAGQTLIISNPGLQSLSLPALRTVDSLTIHINDPALGCDDLVGLVCSLDPDPEVSTLDLRDGVGACCGGGAPTCP